MGGFYVEYREPGCDWVRIASFGPASIDKAVKHFTLTCVNVSDDTEVRLVAPAGDNATRLT